MIGWRLSEKAGQPLQTCVAKKKKKSNSRVAEITVYTVSCLLATLYKASGLFVTCHMWSRDFIHALPARYTFYHINWYARSNVFKIPPLPANLVHDTYI